MTARYAAGPGWAVISPHLVVLVQDAEPAVLDALWHLGHRDDFSALGAVATLSGGALNALPSFALLVLGAEPRLLIRGAYTAIVERADTQESWKAADVSTWSEHRLDGQVRGLTLTSSIETAVPEMHLPIASGVVAASAVRLARLGVADREQTDEPRVVPAPVLDSVPTVVSQPDVLADAGASPAEVPPDNAVAPPEDGEVPPEDAAPAEPRSRDTLADPVGESYDALFGPTIARRPEDAAVRPIEDVPLSDDVPVGSASESEIPLALQHDGMTIAQQARMPGVVSGPPDIDGPAPGAVGVRAHLELSDGRSFSLERPVYFGRAPEALGASIEALPQLVTVESPNGEVSRTHVEVRREGEDVLVRDVSSNGTLLIRPGQQPERLTARRDTLLTHGSALLLGDEVSISVTIEPGT